MDVDKLINDILTRLKIDEVEQKNDDEGGSYQPEKIVCRASDLVKSHNRDNAANKRISDMQHIRPSKYNSTYGYNYVDDAKRFYDQGMFMADYEDDYNFTGQFYQYCPKYAYMNTPQLRGYFSWRTKFRQNIFEKTEISFVYLYAYELLNNIGTSTPEDGYKKLLQLRDTHSQIDGEASCCLNKSIDKWLVDYVVYYNLDINLIKKQMEKRYEYIFVLENIKDAFDSSDAEKFCINLSYFSSYKILSSKFYKLYPQEYASVLMCVYNAFNERYLSRFEKPYFEKIFGKVINDPVALFENAVFYNREVETKQTIYINDFLTYKKYKNSWTIDIYALRNINKALISEIMKNTECYMREYYDFNYKIKPIISTKINDKIINETVLDYCTSHNLINLYSLTKRKKKNKSAITELQKEPPKPVIVEIDKNKFDVIRKISMDVQEKLVTEEEMENNNILQVSLGNIAAESVNIQNGDVCLQKNNSNSDVIFEPWQVDIIRDILNGNSHKAIETARERKIMFSIVLEQINEKFIDIIGDNAIDMINDNTAEIIEEYIDEVKRCIGG